MGLIRNKEIRQMLYAMTLITLAGTTAAHAFSTAATVITGASCILTGAVFLLFTGQRYKRLAHLSDYLKRVNGGDYALELPGSDEGELSILKSEIYKVTVSLNEQNERLQREKLQLADSLSDISHQFKTPLTSMSVMADLLLSGRLDEGRRTEFAGQIRAQLERLKWLTDALLKLSRLDAEAVVFNRRPVPLRALMERACEPLLIPMELKEQAYSLEIDDSDLNCDLNWTAEALTNVLKNCIEYTPASGEIRISASTNTLFTEIRILDGGPGLGKTELPFIFDRFYRGKNAAKDSVGIGLAMARAIVQAQGGSLEARNAHPGGMEFILRFPKLNDIND